MKFGEQRIAAAMLRKIETHTSRMFAVLGVAAKVVNINFGNHDFNAKANYFELPKDWLALCYYHKLRGETLPLAEPPAMESYPGNVKEFVRDNNTLLGFSGIVTTRQGSKSLPAVFLNGSEGSSAEACHTLIHEIIHMLSYKSRGFQKAAFKEEWAQGMIASLFRRKMAAKDRLENVNKEYYSVLDEGITEFFSRIVTQSLQLETSAPMVPRLRNIPVYEFPLAIACDLARTFGVSMLAKAFFDGDLEWHKKLAEKERDDAEKEASKTISETGLYNGDYFPFVAGLDINSGNYLFWQDPDNPDHQKTESERRFQLSRAKSYLNIKVNRLDGLRGLGIAMPDPKKLEHTAAANYSDPAVAVWNKQIGDVMTLTQDPESAGTDKKWVVHPVIVTVGGAAAIYTTYKILKE